MEKNLIVLVAGLGLGGCFVDAGGVPEERGTARLAAAACVEDIQVTRYEGVIDGTVTPPPISREGTLVLHGAGFVANGSLTWVTDVTAPITSSLLSVPQSLTNTRLEIPFESVNGRRVRVVQTGGPQSPVHCSPVVDVDARTPLADGTLPEAPQVTGWNGLVTTGWLRDVPRDGWGVFYGTALHQEGLTTLVRVRTELSCPSSGACDRESELIPAEEAEIDFTRQFVYPVDYAGPNQYPGASQVNWPFPDVPIAADPRVNGLAVEVLLAERLSDRSHVVASSGPLRVYLAP